MDSKPKQFQTPNTLLWTRYNPAHQHHTPPSWLISRASWPLKSNILAVENKGELDYTSADLLRTEPITYLAMSRHSIGKYYIQQGYFPAPRWQLKHELQEFSNECVPPRSTSYNVGFCPFLYLVCDIIDNDDAIGTSVVTGRDCPEPLLTSSVPLNRDKKNTLQTHWDHKQKLTIWSLMVFPSNSTVRIF